MKKAIFLSAALTAAAFAFPGMLVSGPGGDGARLANQQQCTMDIQCGVGRKCTNGVCTGGIAPKIQGRCVKGDFGKKVCSNTGKECMNDSQCLQ